MEFHLAGLYLREEEAYKVAESVVKQVEQNIRKDLLRKSMFTTGEG